MPGKCDVREAERDQPGDAGHRSEPYPGLRDRLADRSVVALGLDLVAAGAPLCAVREIGCPRFADQLHGNLILVSRIVRRELRVETDRYPGAIRLRAASQAAPQTAER